MEFDVKIRPIEEIKRYTNNPRVNADAIDEVARSLKDFGWRQPLVVDKDDVIVVGDTRYLAAKKLGMKEVPVHVAAELTPAQARAYRIADNKTGEVAEWDFGRLAEEMQALVVEEVEFDVTATGFTEMEISALLEGEEEDLEGEGDGYEQEVHKKRKTKCPSCGHEF